MCKYILTQIDIETVIGIDVCINIYIYIRTYFQLLSTKRVNLKAINTLSDQILISKHKPLLKETKDP